MQSKTVERVALALTSDDLRLMQSACPLDKVISSGWSSRTESLGSIAFWAKYAADGGRINALVKRSRKVMVSMARRKKQGGAVHELHALATLAVAYWLSDKCRSCQGRGFLVLDGAQVESGLVCQTCGGSGLAPMPRPDDAGIEMDAVRFERMTASLLLLLDEAMCAYVAKTLSSLKY